MKTEYTEYGIHPGHERTMFHPKKADIYSKWETKIHITEGKITKEKVYDRKQKQNQNNAHTNTQKIVKYSAYLLTRSILKMEGTRRNMK